MEETGITHVIYEFMDGVGSHIEGSCMFIKIRNVDRFYWFFVYDEVHIANWSALVMVKRYIRYVVP